MIAETIERELIATQPVSFRVEGVSVEQLFDAVYGRLRRPTAERGIRLRFEVIAWEPLSVAADGPALLRAIEAVVCSAMAERGVQNITLRAFPCEDDSCVLFEVLDDRRNAIGYALPWSDLLNPPRDAVERMRGEMGAFWREEGGAGVHFWLPQWI